MSFKTRLLRGGINVFILYHLFAIYTYNLPTSELKTQVSRWTKPYLNILCLGQNWAMFVAPGTQNMYMEVRITYADGTQRVRSIGRQDYKGVWEQLINERSRKLMEYTFDTAHKDHYPQLARWAVRKNARETKCRVVYAEVLRYWSPIPAPPEGIHQPPIGKWYSEVSYKTTADELFNPKKKGQP